MKSKQPWINWLKERQKTKGFKSSDTVESLLKEWKKTKDGKNYPLSLRTAQAYVSEAFEGGATKLFGIKYPELNLLTEEYIKDRLLEGKNKAQIKNQWAIENKLLGKLSEGRGFSIKNDFDSSVQTRITIVINKNKDLKKLYNEVQKNKDPNLNLKRYNKFLKDNISKYETSKGVYKPGYKESLYKDAVKFFKKNYPGSVVTAIGLKGGQARIPTGTEYIRIKAGPGAAATSYERGGETIRKLAQSRMPTSVGTFSKPRFERLTARDARAAEALGITPTEYKNKQENLIRSVRKLFPSLYRTPYSPSVEHAYGLQQAIATNMEGEIKKAAKGIYPSTKKLNVLMKGPLLDKKVTTQLRLAYEAADKKTKQKYINSANKLISEYKETVPGNYPKYKLTGRNNIVNINPPGPGMLKSKTDKIATAYIDDLIKTPGFFKSKEFRELPTETSELILSRGKKSYEKNLNLFIKDVKGTRGACRQLLASKLGGSIDTCEAVIRSDPEGAAQKISGLKPTSAALGKVRNAASAFLKFAGKGKAFAVTAGVGAGAGALVKAFRNDDPETYLTNDKQANAMILDTADQLEREERQAAVGDAPELLDEANIATSLGVTAAAIPGSKKVFDARKKKGFGAVRAGLGPVGKALSGFATPLGIAATTPLNVASQVYQGDSAEEILTDPLNYLGPAVAGSLTKEATAGMPKGGMLNKALRLGMSPAGVRGVTKFLGLPGLALSLGYEGYDQYKKYTEGRGFVYNLLNKDE